MTIVSPSILSCDFLNIEDELNYLNSIKNTWIHLDIMDGHFVPNLTFGHPVVKKISSLSTNPLDAHLMVNNPRFYVDTFKDYNLHNITFHQEVFNNTTHLNQLLSDAKKRYPSIGISIKPNTPVDSLEKSTLELVDLVLIMSVEPGFGGQTFIENTYNKLNQLKEAKQKFNTNFIIQLDGGVNGTNAKKIIEHGVTNLVAGSYIFNTNPQNYKHKIETLLRP